MRKLFLTLALILSPALASAAVSISTIGVSAGVVTVTTGSAHGLVTNVGVCLSAPASVCTVTKTVPSGTTFTFDQPSNNTVAPCASSCGSGDLAPKVVVLQVTPSQSTKIFNYLLWLTTLTPLPKSGAVSAWIAGAGSAGATTAQNNAIAAGSFIEVSRSVSFPSSQAIADIQTYVQNDYNSTQAALAGNTQPGAFFGSVWNGVAWGNQ